MMRIIVRAISLMTALVAMMASSPSYADSYSGTITQLQAVDTGSMHLRVSLSTTMTNCDLNFAFIETSSSLFSLYSAMLMSARASGKPVNLQVNREASGFCRIYFASY